MQLRVGARGQRPWPGRRTRCRAPPRSCTSLAFSKSGMHTWLRVGLLHRRRRSCRRTWSCVWRARRARPGRRRTARRAQRRPVRDSVSSVELPCGFPGYWTGDGNRYRCEAVLRRKPAPMRRLGNQANPTKQASRRNSATRPLAWIRPARRRSARSRTPRSASRSRRAAPGRPAPRPRRPDLETAPEKPKAVQQCPAWSARRRSPDACRAGSLPRRSSVRMMLRVAQRRQQRAGLRITARVESARRWRAFASLMAAARRRARTLPRATCRQ